MSAIVADPSFLQDTQKLYRKEKHTMDARGRRSPPKDEEVHGNLANTHHPNERRSSNYVPHSFVREHMRSLFCEKRRKTTLHLLRKQLFTRGRTCNKKVEKILPGTHDNSPNQCANQTNALESREIKASSRWSLAFRANAISPPEVKDYTQCKKADALSKLALMTFEHLTKEVLVEVLAKRSTGNMEILQVEVKEGESLMTPIYEYLLSGLLPEDPRKFRKIRIKAPEYKLIKGSLYKKSFFTPWLRCIPPPDATKVIRNYSKCKEQSTAKKAAGKEAIATGSVWPFSHCGVSILGPLPMAPGGESFVTKDDRNAAKENAKRKERKEVASIEEAYYQNKLRMYHDVKSNRST
ncbi:hypothetical protein Tco_1100480 [Tanacetum coccineum]